MADGGEARVAASADAPHGAHIVTVEVAYSACAASVDRVTLRLPDGSSVAEALRHSGLAGRHPALRDAAASGLALGIWGRRCSPQQRLRDGDRVEIYRPLQIDPMQARRDRQRCQKAAAAGRPTKAAAAKQASQRADPAVMDSPSR